MAQDWSLLNQCLQKDKLIFRTAGYNKVQKQQQSVIYHS